MGTRRLFIAVELGSGQRESARRLLEGLKTGTGFTRAHPHWVDPAALHLTLKFLGETDQARIEPLCRAVDQALAGQAAFDLELGGLGVFPNPRQPRVLWVGVRRGKRELRRLHERIDLALRPFAVPREAREFHPHLTLARTKALRGAAEWMNIVQAHQGKSELGRDRVTEIVLFRSELRPEGPLYTPEHRWPLQPPLPPEAG